jgi:NADH-quinone oxidoreductase subunit L
LPLIAAALTAILGPKLLRQYSHLPVVLGIIGSFVCSFMLLMQVNDAQRPASGGSNLSGPATYEHIVKLWTWLDVPNAYEFNGKLVNLSIDVTLRADALTAVMLCMVTFIAALVAIFAAGYMRGDRGYWRFFSYVGLFVFSMTMLVSVSNFILLFVFWEAVGVCSYLLIGFWYEKPEAAAAGICLARFC